MRIPQSRLVVPIVGAALMLGAGCTPKLDTNQLELELKTQIEEQLGASDVTVECPADISAEAGATFECTASDLGGRSFVVTVTQSDDEGNVSWAITGEAT
jgi:hypothetical protein